MQDLLHPPPQRPQRSQPMSPFPSPEHIPNFNSSLIAVQPLPPLLPHFVPDEVGAGAPACNLSPFIIVFAHDLSSPYRRYQTIQPPSKPITPIPPIWLHAPFFVPSVHVTYASIPPATSRHNNNVTAARRSFCARSARSAQPNIMLRAPASWTQGLVRRVMGVGEVDEEGGGGGGGRPKPWR